MSLATLMSVALFPGTVSLTIDVQDCFTRENMAAAAAAALRSC